MEKDIVLTILVFVFVKDVLTVETTRELEGYSRGFLTHCPGSTKEARISKTSLKKLAFFLLDKGHFLIANRTLYNYYQMNQLAEKMDFTKKTVLYMNGYMDSSNFNFVTPAMGSVYTELGYNVLLLEYVEFSSRVYPRAVRFLRPVGKHTAEMLSALADHGLDPQKLELLGISHGGQGISFIAKSYQQITGRNISRVTSLDPAGPCFRRLGPKDRIDASDADFVDIIHTSIESWGFAGAVGHVDFYVNGGEFQIAPLANLPCSGFCSHISSYPLWVAAIMNPNSLIGVKCDSVQDARDKNCFKKPLVTNIMGPKTDRGKPGIYYLATRNVFPYFMGKKGLVGSKHDISNNYLKQLNEKEVLVL